MTSLATITAPIGLPTRTSRPMTSVWGLPYTNVTTAETVEWVEELVGRAEPTYLVTANLNWAMLSHQRPDLAAVNRDAAGLVADGMPIVWRSRFGSQPSITERVAGSELIYLLAERAALRGWGIYFLGGIEGVAERASQVLKDRYPGLRIAGVDCPPFRPLTDSEEQTQLQKIRDSKAQLLFVAFGQPKGELWLHRHYRDLGVPVSMQLGASFDFIAGTVKRAPALWQRLGVEWAYRMASDPKRLVPRYAANAKFLGQALWSEIRR